MYGYYPGTRDIDQTRALLDELMGSDRNVRERKKRRSRRKRWFHKDVCQNYLCGWCPQRQFQGTRVDIGFCNKVHNGILRDEFEKEPSRIQRKNWEEYTETLEVIADELQLRIDRNRLRLCADDERTQKINSLKPSTTEIPTVNEHNMESHISEIRLKIINLEKQIENKKKLEGQHCFPALQKVLEKLKELEQNYQKRNSPCTKQNEICEICGGIQDKTRELKNSHTMGKLHQGYLRFREEFKIASNKMEEYARLSSSYSMSSSSSSSASRSRSYSSSRSRSKSRRRSRTISRSRSRS